MEERYQSPLDDSAEKHHLELSRKKINDYKEGLMDQIKANEEKKRQNRLL